MDRGKSLVHYFQEKNGEEEFVKTKLETSVCFSPSPSLLSGGEGRLAHFLSQTLNTPGESQQVSRPSTLRTFHLGDLQAPHK